MQRNKKIENVQRMATELGELEYEKSLKKWVLHIWSQGEKGDTKYSYLKQ